MIAALLELHQAHVLEIGLGDEGAVFALEARNLLLGLGQQRLNLRCDSLREVVACELHLCVGENAKDRLCLEDCGKAAKVCGALAECPRA